MGSRVATGTDDINGRYWRLRPFQGTANLTTEEGTEERRVKLLYGVHPNEECQGYAGIRSWKGSKVVTTESRCAGLVC